MYSANRYLVWWQSSVTGDHYETKHSPREANRLLEKREQREHFVRGVVIDMDDYTQSPDAFRRQHNEFVRGAV